MLFVWSGLKSLERYGTGMAIVQASSVKAARIIAGRKFLADQIAMYGLPEFYEEKVWEFQDEINLKEPQIFEANAVFILWGSE